MPEVPGADGASFPLSWLPEVFEPAVCVMDEQGAITSANRQAERLLGVDAPGLVGQDGHYLLHRDRHGRPLAKAQCELVRASLAREARSGRGWFGPAGGEVRELDWMVVPCALPGARAMVVFTEAPAGRRPPESGGTGRERGGMSELDYLALLAETTTQLTSTLDSDEALSRLVDLVLPKLADWAVVDLITEENDVDRVLVAHHENGVTVRLEELQGPMPAVPQESSMPLSRALRGAASTLVTPSTYQGPPDTGVAIEQRRLFEATGMRSAAIGPIPGVRKALGALTLGRATRRAPMTTADLPVLADIARRVGLALGNARLYQRQRAVAETMQRHLLPHLPTGTGVQMAARYFAAPDVSQVGGDWYDAFTRPDGAIALVIGDVVGHDLDAAAGMAQVRSMLRAHAWTRRKSPGAIVTRLDEIVEQLTEVPMATLVLGILHRAPAGQWQLTWTNAGHPPPLLVTRDGEARYLTDGHGLLLGTGLNPSRGDARTLLPPRSTLVFYTDGLVESRSEPITVGMERLRGHAVSLAHRPLNTFTDLLLERARHDLITGEDDDIAILTLRTPPAGAPTDPPQARGDLDS
jgi:hypothetical protein